jgi:hypothetical protein
VDKPDFLHKLKGLRAFEAAGQGLFLKRSKTGQKIGCVQVDRFRTFDPVDIHGLVHRAAQFAGKQGLAGRSMPPSSAIAARAETTCGLEVVLAAGFALWPESNFFFGQIGLFKIARQVYNQKLVYRIVVIVNVGAHLWITMVLPTRSAVYAPHKAVGRPCICQVEKMDKNRRCGKSRAFAQSVPVDMQKLIHSHVSFAIW